MAAEFEFLVPSAAYPERSRLQAERRTSRQDGVCHGRSLCPLVQTRVPRDDASFTRSHYQEQADLKLQKSRPESFRLRAHGVGLWLMSDDLIFDFFVGGLRDDFLVNQIELGAIGTSGNDFLRISIADAG